MKLVSAWIMFMIIHADTDCSGWTEASVVKKWTDVQFVQLQMERLQNITVQMKGLAL